MSRRVLVVDDDSRFRELVRMLLEGGNAVDAAVAVASTLNVVEPFMSGAAGIGLMMISRARTGERHVLDFIGPAPRASDPARCTEDELAGGPKSCATPGNVGGWLTALATMLVFGGITVVLWIGAHRVLAQ